MIQSVEIQNFKNIRHQKIDLERLTVFVGPNGCGKTSVLQAIELAVKTIVDREFPTKQWWMDRDTLEYRHPESLVTKGQANDLRIVYVTGEGSFEALPLEKPAVFDESPTGRAAYEIAKKVGETRIAELKTAARILKIHFTVAGLSDPVYSDRLPPLLHRDGNGLPSVLAYMALNDPDGFDSLVAEFRKLIPQVRRIRFTKMPVTREETEIVRFGNESIERRSTREYQGDAILFDYDNAKGVLAQTVSEGTMLLLGLLTVLLGPDAPDVLLIDDIEHGLHPLAQKQLLETLNQIMKRFPDLQILATAHSPYLLDGLKPEQVRMMTIGKDGYSVCGKLTDHPEFEKWKDEMAPGELWSLFGEKWLLDAGVAP